MQYVLGREIGRGSFGRVCEARDGNGNAYAVKLADNEESKQLLRQQFQTLSSLDHPRIVRAYDFGPEYAAPPASRLQMATDLIDGPDLGAYVDSHGTRDLALITARILDALRYLHGLGCFHGDIKPGSILVVKGADGPDIRLVDVGFGAADKGSLPRIFGTPAYMAPEIIRDMPADGRADLYSLGVTLYEMLTGISPFAGGTREEVLSRHLEHTPPRPSRSGRPGATGTISGGWDDFIGTLLKKEPVLRYRDATHAGLELEKALGMPGIFTGNLLPPRSTRPVEREAEIRAVMRLVSSPGGGGLLLCGPRGSGVSRLLREACVLASLAGHRVHAVSLDKNMPGIAQIAADLLGLEAEMPDFNPPSGSTPSPDPALRLGELLRAFESGLSGGVKHLLLIDGGEALEPRELRVLGALAGSSHSLKIVAGYQDRGGPDCEFAPEEALDRIAMNDLSRDGVNQVASLYLGRAAVPSGLADELHGATGGRPGLLQPTLAHMWRSGSLKLQPTGDELGVLWDKQVELPAQVREAERDLIAGLSDEGVEGLKLMAAAGGWLDARMLRAVLQSMAEAVIDELLGSGMVEKNQEGAIHFHTPGPLAAVREVISEQELATLSRRLIPVVEASSKQVSDFYRLGLLHLQCGQAEAAFRELAGAGDYFSRFSERDALLAYGKAIECGASHGAEAGIGRAVGGVDPGVAEAGEVDPGIAEAGGVDPGLIAATEEKIADLYLSMGEFGEAESMLERASALRPTALRKIGWVKVLKRELDEAEEILGRCRDEAAARGDDVETAHVLCDLGYALSMNSRQDRGLPMLKQAALMFEERHMAREAGTARNRVGFVETRSGNHKSAARAWESARQDFDRAGYERGAAVCLMSQGLSYRKQMDFDRADACFVQALEALKDTWWMSERATCQQNYGLLLLDRGHLGLASEIVAEALKINRILGKATGVLNATIVLAAIDLENGNWQAAEEKLEEMISTSTVVGVFHRAMIRRYQAVARTMAGDTKAAFRLAEESLDLAREAADSEGQGQAMLVGSAVLLREGRAREGVEQARQASAALTLSSSILLANEAQRLLGEGLCELGDVDSAIEVLTIARDQLEGISDSLYMGKVMRSLAHAHCLAQDYESFSRYLRRALEIFRSANARYDSALAILLGGQVAARRGNLIQARHFLREAERIFEALGIDDLRKKAGEEMNRLPAGEHEIRAVNSLSRISQTLNSSRDLTTVLHLAMDLALEYLGAERGVLILSDETSGELTTFVEREMDRESLDEVMNISRSIVESVRSTGLPVVASDATRDPRFKDSRSVRMHNIMSVMCIPLKMREKLLGVIYLDSRGVPAGFSELERSFVEAFANQVALAISNARFVGRLYDDVADLRLRAGERYSFDNIIGPGKKMQEVFRQVEKAAKSTIGVLLTGDNGTGKELIAGLLHELSPRRDKPMIKVNCAAIQRDLLETELFGIENRVATGISPRSGFFERAEGGTIFLDEVGDMPPATQRRVLRVLQEKEFERVGGSKVLKADVRVISATNQDLKAKITRDEFRKDLYYRLNGMRIHLPALRDRMEDLPVLVDHFMEKYCRLNSKPRMGVLPEVMSILRRYPWPGNVRELENCIEHAVVIADGLEIGSEHLPEEILETHRAPVSVVHLDSECSTLPEAIRLLERRHILRALEDAEWVQTAAARSLGIHESTLRKKMKQLSIEREQKTA